MSGSERASASAAVDLALEEDLGPDALDLTAVALGTRPLQARLVARSAGIVCGLEVARIVFKRRGVEEFDAFVRDGDTLEAGQQLGAVQGRAAAVLGAERVALNFLQQLSGVATLTRRFVDAVAATPAGVYDTRKTVPGLRALQRHAVRCGGGVNHRFGLFDAAMVKDNHIDAVGMEAAVAAIRKAHPQARLIVETRQQDEVEAALRLGADVVLLDNMDVEALTLAVGSVAGRAETEASGGITLETVAAIAATGVDRMSIGALTHSAPALDIALDASSELAYSQQPSGSGERP